MRHGSPCPKCGGHSRLEQLQTPDITDKKSIFANIPFTRCVCLNCGYFEDWYLPERLKEVNDRLDRSYGGPGL